MGKLNKLLAFHQPSKCAKGGRGAGSIPYTDENMKHIAWCHSNGISIGVIPNWETSTSWNIDITLKGKVNKDPKDYTDEEALIKMYEYYKYYYDKYEK